MPRGNSRLKSAVIRAKHKFGLSKFSHAISRCNRHFKRWWKLTKRKWKRIKKIDHQIKDALHKHTTKFLKYCKDKGIGTIVLGNLTGIRDNINYGKR